MVIFNQKCLNYVDEIEQSISVLGNTQLSSYIANFKIEVSLQSDLHEMQVLFITALFRESLRRINGIRLNSNQTITILQILLANKKKSLVEMETGAGKTYICAALAFVYSITADNVYILVPNETLKERDSSALKNLFQFLSCGNTITYLSASEFIFNFLNNELNFSQNIINLDSPIIVDEMDSLLVDFANTPFIISETETRKPIKYSKYLTLKNNTIKPILNNMPNYLEGSFPGHRYNYPIQILLGAIDIAYNKLKNNRDYFLENNNVVLLDKGSGRKLDDHSYEEHIQNALYEKEGINKTNTTKKQNEIYVPAFFSMLPNVIGLTGTTSGELKKIFDFYLFVPKIGHRKCSTSLLFQTTKDKNLYLKYFLDQNFTIKKPMLVGTFQLSNCLELNSTLEECEIKKQTIHAKNVDLELEQSKIQQIALPQKITTTTNILGRGVDIQLNNNNKNPIFYCTLMLGGLTAVLANTRQSNRTLKQFQGRVARQGQPGQAISMSLVEDTPIYDEDGSLITDTKNHILRRKLLNLRNQINNLGIPTLKKYYTHIYANSIYHLDFKEESIVQVPTSTYVKTILMQYLVFKYHMTKYTNTIFLQFNLKHQLNYTITQLLNKFNWEWGNRIRHQNIQNNLEQEYGRSIIFAIHQSFWEHSKRLVKRFYM